MIKAFFITTLGCKINQYESQALREAWLDKGWREAATPDEASLILVNSCAITSKAVADVRASVRKLHRSAPDTAIIVTGCAVEVMREELAALPGVRAVVTQATKTLLLQVIPTFSNEDEKETGLDAFDTAQPAIELSRQKTDAVPPVPERQGKTEPGAGLAGRYASASLKAMPQASCEATKAMPQASCEVAKAMPQASCEALLASSDSAAPLVFFDTQFPKFSISGYTRSRAVLKIQDGCSHYCSYCIVPYTRGKARSRPVDEALAEASRLLEAGFREIIISGVNLRQYGDDWNKKQGTILPKKAVETRAFLDSPKGTEGVRKNGKLRENWQDLAKSSQQSDEYAGAEYAGDGPDKSRWGESSNLIQEPKAALALSGVADFWAFVSMLEDRFASEWAGRARFRISSLEPGQLHEQALAVLGGSRLIAPHLHLSLQSGSVSVLKRMRRGHYSLAFVSAFFADLRSKWPVFGLGADLISGFPGETGAEHAETMAFCASLPLTYAHVFPYSSRPGTKATTMPGHIEHGIKKARAAELRGIMAEKQSQFLTSQLALDHVFLVPEQDSTKINGPVHGVNEFYANCILASEKPTKGAASHPLPKTGIVKAKPVKVQRNRLVTIPLEVIK